ncbi:MAG: hypothetical protein ABR562_04485 [Thermoplasmatota archaeon]|nr:hypothetical protein [Halobacteriales archaeon]
MGRGSPRDEVDALGRLFESSYPSFRWIRPPSESGWLAAYDVPTSPVDAVFNAFSRFCDEAGLDLQWGHVESGVVTMRVLVEDPAAGEHLAGRLRAYLGDLGPQAAVRLEADADEGLAVWLQALRRAGSLDQGAAPRPA